MNTAREESTRLADLLRREHHALAEFLIALAAFDRERRWVDLGYDSLFRFLTRELRLSAGAAQYRKSAAELVQRFPEIEAALRRGDLCLTSVVEVAKVLTPENVAEVLPRFFGKSSRDAAFIAASIRPVESPPVRQFLVTPARAAPAADASARPGDARDDVLRAPETSAAQIPPAPDPALLTPAAPHDKPKIRPLNGERARVNMTVSRRLLDKLAAARDALSHSHPGATEETILELGLDLIIERHRKRRGIGCKPRERAATSVSSSTITSQVAVADPEKAVAAPPRPSPPPPARSRHVPAAVWRAVWERDEGKCQWPLEGRGICASTHQVEVDHVDGWARGGATSTERCRLLCRFHQDVAARRMYRDATMDRFTRPKGGTCSEPVAPYLAVFTDVEAGGQVVAPPEDAVSEAPAPAARPGRGPSRNARRGPSARYLANATFSRRSFSSRVPMDRRMQPSRPL